MKRLTILLIGLFFAASSFSQNQVTDYDQNWPEWRGPYLTGEFPNGNPPTEWSETQNIKWKVNIKGTGHSTPVAWGNKLFVASAFDTGEKPGQTSSGQGGGSGMSSSAAQTIYEFILTAYNREDGSVLWQKTLAEEVPLEGTHPDGSWASNSPITDGEHVYAYFGSRGIHCLDMDGNLIWSRDFGQMEKKMSFGEGSSPALYNNRIAIVWDHEGQSVIYVLDKNTGEDVWQANRDEGTSWSTPIIVDYNGQAQIITAATNKVRSYDLETGEIIWQTSGLTANAIPHPMYKDGVVYVMTGYQGFSVMAIDLAKAKGDIGGSDAIIWSYNRNTPYTPSPLMVDGKLYYYRSNNGSLSCVNAKDGTIYYEGAELADFGNAYPSPVAANGNLFLIGGSGNSYVAKQGENFEIISQNVLNDNFTASPVIVGNDLYLKGSNYLYCISED